MVDAVSAPVASPAEQLKKLGHTLPPVPKPVASYVPWVRTGNLLFISGQVPIRDGKAYATGKVGKDLTLAQAQEVARQVALQALAVAQDALGSLDKVRRIVRVAAYTNPAPGFTEAHLVANGASDLLVQVFGDKGRHTRVALGAGELPLGVPFELDVIFEVG